MQPYQLEQVIVFSRHGIRTPLPNTVDLLKTITAKHWPKWHCPAGYLTTRGGTLESYFGDYFINWLAQLQVTLSPDNIFIYANSLQRTVATAQYFALGAFAGLDIPVHHQYPIERMDAIFNPLIRDDSAKFKTQIMADLKHYTGSSQLIEKLDQTLKSAYTLLADILGYKHSDLYQQYQCEFTQLPTTIDITQHKEPALNGPLAMGTAVADAFTLQHYSGFDKQNVAWGLINTPEQVANDN